MIINKEDVMKAGGSLQVCVTQDASPEPAIDAVHNIFKDQNTEAVSLIDSENAFTVINKKKPCYITSHSYVPSHLLM